MTDPIALRAAVREADRLYKKGAITLDDLYAIVDSYIEAVMVRAKEKRWKLRRPSRSYVLRAIT